MNPLNHSITVTQLTKKRVDTQINVLKLNTLNEIKKDYTNIKIFKNSYFDSNFNYLQSLNGDLYQQMLNNNKNYNNLKNNIKKSKFSVSTISAILRAYRTIRLNRGEWKLIRLLILGNNYAANLNKKIKHSCTKVDPNFCIKKQIMGYASKASKASKANTSSLSLTRIGVVNLIANFFINKNKLHYNKIIGYKFNTHSNFFDPFRSKAMQAKFEEKKTEGTAFSTGEETKFTSLNKELYKTTLQKKIL